MKPQDPAVSHGADPAFDSYFSVAGGKAVDLKVKGSRFLGQAFRVENQAERQACLEAVRRAHHKATHHCWASRLAPPHNPWERADDDGEPAGTAGPPILSILRAEGLLDVLLVVTRYFGGTKLGKGGLVRAYSESARLALAGLPRIEVTRDQRLILACTYDDLGAVEAVLARSAADIRKVRREFAEGPSLTLWVRPSRAHWLGEALTNATNGRCRLLQDEAP